MQVKCGEVWWVDFDPPRGGEITKVRPAVIVSNDVANEALNRVVVVPVTSRTDRVYPGETLITVNHDQRKAMADQIMTASKERLKSRLTILSSSDVNRVENAIKVHLGLEL